MAENIDIEDFSKENDIGDWNGYTLEKECEIFGKALGKGLLKLSTHKNQSLKNSISKINEYMDWLGGNRKDELIDSLCEHINSYSSVTAEELLESKWYETLQIGRVLLTITEAGKIGADISCYDNYDKDHILDIELLEKTIKIAGYDG